VRPGDILLALIVKGNQSELKTIEQFNKLLSGLDKTSVFTLLVRRGENQTFVTIKGLGDKSGDK
jgi:serine protease Do